MSKSLMCSSFLVVAGKPTCNKHHLTAHKMTWFLLPWLQGQPCPHHFINQVTQLFTSFLNYSGMFLGFRNRSRRESFGCLRPNQSKAWLSKHEDHRQGWDLSKTTKTDTEGGEFLLWFNEKRNSLISKLSKLLHELNVLFDRLHLCTI